jgi:hypothetical protein
VARALDVPLYRKVITGDALDKRSEYGSRDPAQRSGIQGDETEDLFELLTTIKVCPTPAWRLIVATEDKVVESSGDPRSFCRCYSFELPEGTHGTRVSRFSPHIHAIFSDRRTDVAACS